MHSIVVFVESLIAPHQQVLAGIEFHRAQHNLEWSVAVMTQGRSLSQVTDNTFYLTIHSRLIPESLNDSAVVAQRPILGLFGSSSQHYHPCISLQEQAFGDLAAHHFADLGLRHIAYIPSARPQSQAHFTAYYQGLREACSAMGMSVEELPPGSADGDMALCAALHQHSKPLGIYCATDAQAAWLLERCTEEGLRVPEEVAILGTSDHPHHCQRRRPALSSIAFPWFLMGRALGQAVHRQISGVARPETQILRPLRVIERESSAGLLPTDPLIAASLAWLKRHVQESQPLVACAAAQGCSVPTLSRRFRKVLGSSVKQVHARVRHRQAMHLLASSNKSIAAVAEACGYADAAALSVAFKRQSGWSPGRWRLAARS